eukprot:SM000004S15016  [mRNA]  locus=s4:771019:774750:- [translate_table: standard]
MRDGNWQAVVPPAEARRRAAGRRRRCARTGEAEALLLPVRVLVDLGAQDLLHQVLRVLAGDRRHRASREAVKKPDGVHREVFALTGGVAPIALSAAAGGFKSKAKPAAAHKVKWKWRPFSNSARKDGLQLHHWARVSDGEEPQGDYIYAKYNKAVEMVRYTEDEYLQQLHDPRWSKDETDHLFDLCARFDLRFIVIADRYQQNCNWSSRSVEELKDRYYTKELFVIFDGVYRRWMEPFNLQHEVERKHALSLQLMSSRHQELEEAEVLAEAKRVMEERDLVPRVASAHADDGASLNGILGDQHLRNFANDANHASPTATPSSRPVTVKPKVPTRAVCSEFLALRKAVLSLLGLQKRVSWKENEVALLRENPYAAPTRFRDGDKLGSRGDGEADRSQKRDQKRKAPHKQADALPTFAQQQKRARRLKVPED